jgi:hypothetical protein
MVSKPFRSLTILGQDPALRAADGTVLTAQVQIPNEELSAGPRGYRVQVVDYDASASRMYTPLDPAKMGSVAEPRDPFASDEPANSPSASNAAGADTQARTRTRKDVERFNARFLNDPQFHAQNVYAIVMRTLMHFERALGRRVSWSFGGHQLKVAPHAFAEPNAFYSPRDEALLFGYFAAPHGIIFTCLSHDIVAHETAHALLDGLRPRYMEPSSPDQAAFHEGFADVVALLSVFSIPEVVSFAVHAAAAVSGQTAARPGDPMMPLAQLTVDALREGVLLGLGEQFGEALSGVHGAALRRSVKIPPSTSWLKQPEFREAHRRGEILVAAMLQTFLQTYVDRLSTLGRDTNDRLPAVRVIEEGSEIADRMLTMAIRALDYMPPTDITFGDYLSALITSDLEIRPDDSRYRLRTHFRESFRAFGIAPAASGAEGGEAGRWESPLDLQPRAAQATRGAKQEANSARELDYNFVHREALERDRDEVFRFLWQNRRVLGLCDEAYTAVGAVRPCLRVDQDGFTLRETVADYVQILTVRADELHSIVIPGRTERIVKPDGLDDWKQVRLLGGGALIFDEFGRLKYHIRNAVLNPVRQTERLRHLHAAGFFDRTDGGTTNFAALHMRGLRLDQPRATREGARWR